MEEGKRKLLPFRLNCEGYFVDNDGKILAKKSDKEHIIFPGGGIDKDEDLVEGMKRETFEETGAIVKNIREIGTITIIWSPTWAKTEKQRARYQTFQGDEMHFFIGEIDRFEEPLKKEEDFWEDKKLMSIPDVIDFINSQRPFPDENEEYYEIQLKYLDELKGGVRV